MMSSYVDGGKTRPEEEVTKMSQEDELRLPEMVSLRAIKEEQVERSRQRAKRIKDWKERMGSVKEQQESHDDKNNKNEKEVTFSLEDRLKFFKGKDIDHNEESFNLLLREWFEDLDKQTESFQSRVVASQVKLAEAMRMTEALPVPNEFLTAVVVNMLKTLSSSFGIYEPVVRRIHSMLHDAIYYAGPDGDISPYFASARQAEKDIEDLREKRRQFILNQRAMKEEDEKQKELFDSTVTVWQKGVLRRTFSAWRKYLILKKRHATKMQLIFAKWWQGESSLRGFFQQWVAYKEASVRKRLNKDLEQGHLDLAYHEKVIQEKEKILKRKQEQAKQLETEHDTKAKQIETEKLSLQMGLNQAETLRESVQTVMSISKRLRKMVDTLASNIVRSVQNNLKTAGRTPDCGVVLDSMTNIFGSMKRASMINSMLQHANDDVILAWLKTILGQYYENRDREKLVVLQNVRTFEQLVQVGLLLDFIHCIPEWITSLAMEEGGVTGEGTEDGMLEFIDVDSFNKQHLDISTKLCAVHSLAQRDSHPLPLYQVQSKPAQAVPGGRNTIKRGSTLIRRGSSRTHSLFSSSVIDTRSSLIANRKEFPDPSGIDATEPQPRTKRRDRLASVVEKQSSTDLAATVDAGGSKQPPRGRGRRSSLSLTNEEIIQQAAATANTTKEPSFIDEDLPLVDLEEVLEAIDPDGDHSSIFLKTFMNTMLLGCPLLQPLISENNEFYRQCAGVRAEFAQLCETGKLVSNEQLNISDGELEQKADELIESVERFNGKWSTIIHMYDNSYKFVNGNKSWTNLTMETEQRIWKTLFQNDGSNILKEKSDHENSPHLQALRKDIPNVTKSDFLQKSHFQQVVKQVVRQRYLGADHDSDREDDEYDDYQKRVESFSQIMGDLFLEYVDVFSVIFKRYSLGCRSVIDLLKETNIIDAEKLYLKKLKAKFNALEPGKAEHLELHHLINACFFAGERSHSLSEYIDMEFVETMKHQVLQKLKECKVLLTLDVFKLTPKQLTALQTLFNKTRSKMSPVGQISLANWKSLMDQKKGLCDKNRCTKPILLEVFAACNNSILTKEAKNNVGLCFTEFVQAMVTIAQIKQPDPFQRLHEKLDTFLSHL